MIFTTHQQLEKVIHKTACVMESRGLNLGLDKCSISNIKAGKECTTDNVSLTGEKVIEGLNEGKFYVLYTQRWHKNLIVKIE